MANLFSSPDVDYSTDTPDIDTAQSTVTEQERLRKMRGRASTMLTEDASASTAARQVTGN